jgi:hypothetical protein
MLLRLPRDSALEVLWVIADRWPLLQGPPEGVSRIVMLGVVAMD